MRLLASSIPVVLMALCLTADNPARAQGYRPATPTLSPWMNLFNRNTGALDNYHTYVRPELRLQENFREQEAVNQRQQAALGSMQRQMTRIEAESNAPVSPTGTNSTFMNLSHYYPMQSTGGRTPKGGGHQAWSPQPARSGPSGGMGGGF